MAESKMIYIENEGALFRGYVVSCPREVYSFKQKKFIPYEGEVPKRFGWGEAIPEAEALSWMAAEN